MSHDSSERDAEKRIPHAEGSGWPIKGFDGTERQTTYIGMASPKSEGDDAQSTALVYDERDETVFQAVIDEEEEQLVPQEGTERELESDDTLGEALEEFGDRLEWDSLSEFARERLQDEDQPTRPAPDAVTFTQSNTSAEADHDLEFSGSYRYRTTDDRERSVERTFEVTFDDPDDPVRATVDVTEQVTQSAAPSKRQDRADADHLETNETAFTIDLASVATDRRLESVIEERCQEWHTSHVEPPVAGRSGSDESAGDGTRDVNS